MPLKVAIVGRPNVGKSTLFNRLLGKRLALVDAAPGVTRDRREGQARLGDLEFSLIDTAGFEDAAGDTLSARMRRQTEAALGEADLALYLIDAQAGVTALDRHFAKLLHRRAKPVVMVANKAEGRKSSAGIAEAFALGFGEPVAISAEHGEGMADLYAALAKFMPEQDGANAAPSRRRRGQQPDAVQSAEAPPPPIQIAIIGRPNVGKSTLINKLLGQERLLTGPEPGLTRDAITIDWRFKGRDFRLIDTAGLRRKARVQEKLEKLATADTLRALKFAEVAILVIDATAGVDRQDLAIAGHVLREGRALVVAANKWDAVEARGPVLREIERKLRETLAETKGLAIAPVSAQTGQGLDRLLAMALDVHTRWNAKIATSKLNRWLAGVTQAHPPPAVKGRAVRLRYMAQTKSRPPTFLIFANRPGALPQSYMRYLGNALRESFDLNGVVVRLDLRRGENPYAKD